MDNYIRCAIHKFYHKAPNNPPQESQLWTTTIYSRKIPQKRKPTSSATPLDTKEKYFIQSIVGTFLYYHKINLCIKPDLNNISTEKYPPTKDVLRKNQHVFHYEEIFTVLRVQIWVLLLNYHLISQRKCHVLVIHEFFVYLVRGRKLFENRVPEKTISSL